MPAPMLHPTADIAAVAVAVAYTVDRWLGEPPPRLHPVVWMGRALGCLGAPWPDRAPRAAFLRGAVAWCLLAAIAMALAAVAAHAVALGADRCAAWLGHPPFLRVVVNGVVLGFLLKPLLAWRMLRDEVSAVEHGLERSLETGRERLGRIVSRDVGALSETVVRESAIESLAENFNDSWVAPLFWFVLAGLPGAALYRFANTADAMWGRRGRWEWAGKWSARADDLLSFVPARIAAAALALAARCWPRGLEQEARATPSPNGGWPMGMMALALGVRLSKPGVYVLNPHGRCASRHDMERALALASLAASEVAALALLLELARGLPA